MSLSKKSPGVLSAKEYEQKAKNCVIPCKPPKQPGSIWRTTKLLIVVVLLTGIIIAWATPIHQVVRGALNFDGSPRSNLSMAILWTIVGVVIIRCMNVNFDDAVGVEI